MPALIERPKMTRAMYDALKTHIIHQRQKKKQEQEADAANQRLRKEKELQVKQEKMTLEQTKEQLTELDKKLETLKHEKHELFLQLKKVLHEEGNRRKAMAPEKSEIIQNPYHMSGQVPGPQHIFLQGAHPAMQQQRAANMYKQPPQQSMISGTGKRPRSPSPTPTSGYQSGSFKAQTTKPFQGSNSNFHDSKTTYSSPQKHESRYPPGGQPSSQGYPTTAGSGQYPGGHPKFTANQPPFPYSGHYGQQGKLQEHVSGQQGYPVPHMQQQGGYVSSMVDPHKPGFGADQDKFYMQQHSVRPTQASMLPHQTMLHMQQAGKTGSIVHGYPPIARPQGPPTTAYQSASTTNQHPSAYNPQGSSRGSYPAQHGRNYY